MDIHKNARLAPHGREHMVNIVLSGQTPKVVSEAVGVCPRTVRKWVGRFEAEGLAGLQDRSSRPHRLRQPTPQAIVDRIEDLRRQRLTGGIGHAARKGWLTVGGQPVHSVLLTERGEMASLKKQSRTVGAPNGRLRLMHYFDVGSG